jgi:hypothetical protein
VIVVAVEQAKQTIFALTVTPRAFPVDGGLNNGLTGSNRRRASWE